MSVFLTVTGMDRFWSFFRGFFHHFVLTKLANSSIIFTIDFLSYENMVLSLLQANDNFTTVFSGGRDRKVWATDIRNPDCRTLICEEKAPVLKVCRVGRSIYKEPMFQIVCIPESIHILLGFTG